MDARHFDTLTRVWGEAGTRRGLLGLLAILPLVRGLAARLDDVAAAGKRGRKRKQRRSHDRELTADKKRKNKKGKKKKRKQCKPQSLAQTCAGKCGPVTNNCKQAVDCGSCACDPICDECFICNEATGACEPDSQQQGEDCGDPGQVCHADGTCACNDNSCDPCAVCQGDGSCSVPCGGNGCCDGDTCVDGTSDTACGTEGGVCQQCGDGAFCSDQQCIGCGDVGDTCCPPDDTCVVGAQCDQGTCMACGMSGQPCCGEFTCLNPLTTTCFLDQCVPCGGRDQLCCGDLCGFPYVCGAGGFPHICGCGFCTPEDNCCAANQLCVDGSCVACDVCVRQGCRYATVQEAIDDPSGPSTIRICAGTYVGNVAVTRNLTLIGVGDGSDPDGNTILDAAGSGSVVQVSRGVTATLQGLRITGGVENGGGINNIGHLSLHACTIAGNRNPFSSGIGGGIYSRSGATLEITDCRIIDNHADNAGGKGGGVGGAGGSFGNSTITLSNSIVSGNSANLGGGIYVAAGSVTLNSGTSVAENTTVGTGVTENTTVQRGAGIFVSTDGAVTLNSGVTVRENTAGGAGGGIHVNFGALTLNSGAVVRQNTAAGGGGINNNAGTVTLNAGSLVCGNSEPQCDGFASPRGFCAGCPA